MWPSATDFTMLTASGDVSQQISDLQPADVRARMVPGVRSVNYWLLMEHTGNALNVHQQKAVRGGGASTDRMAVARAVRV